MKIVPGLRASLTPTKRCSKTPSSSRWKEKRSEKRNEKRNEQRTETRKEKTVSKLYAIVMLVCVAFLTGCEAEMGGADWCAEMDEKSKADWSANEAMKYAEDCIALPGQQ